MAPNFCKLVDSLFNPANYHLYEQNLHYQHEPVEGIYYIDMSNRRFLIAIKPNGKSDVDHIFKAKESSVWSVEDAGTESYRGVSWASTTTLKGSTKSSFLATEKLDHETTIPKGTRSVDFTTQEVSNSAIKNKHDRKPSTLKDAARLFFPLPFLNNLTEYFGASRPITREDNCGGYRNLAERLEVTYSTVLKRWMFVSEIHARTTVFSMCGSEKCLALRHTHCEWQCAKACGSRKCGTMVEREVFLLDDGLSYVIVGDAKKSKVYGREIIKREGVTLEKSALFYSNQWGGMTKMKPNQWCRKRRELFAMNKEGSRILGGVDEQYVKVVDYISGE